MPDLDPTSPAAATNDDTRLLAATLSCAAVIVGAAAAAIWATEPHIQIWVPGAEAIFQQAARRSTLHASLVAGAVAGTALLLVITSRHRVIPAAISIIAGLAAATISFTSYHELEHRHLGRARALLEAYPDRPAHAETRERPGEYDITMRWHEPDDATLGRHDAHKSCAALEDTFTTWLGVSPQRGRSSSEPWREFCTLEAVVDGVRVEGSANHRGDITVSVDQTPTT